MKGFLWLTVVYRIMEEYNQGFHSKVAIRNIQLSMLSEAHLSLSGTLSWFSVETNAKKREEWLLLSLNDIPGTCVKTHWKPWIMPMKQRPEYKWLLFFLQYYWLQAYTHLTLNVTSIYIFKAWVLYNSLIKSLIKWAVIGMAFIIF